ncbi:MAG: hypothetical protein E7447_02430 [Ruminococcaceae bacterium]|nr:hypothetical protein [Oscillospiraceae bacterium]
MKTKIIYGVLAFLIAIGLWLYVVTVVNPEWEDTFHNIPVVLENEDILLERGLMLASNEDPTVTLKLSGNRADMIKLNNGNITIRADLSRIYSAGEQSISYSIVYPGDVPSNAFEVLSQTPQQITLSVVERKSKPVDVVLKLSGAEPGYEALVDEAVLDYEKITIAGPADVIDRIMEAEVLIDLTGQRGTISQQFEYVLRDAAGNAVDSKWVKATPQKIHCTLKIQKVQEVSVAVEILEGAGITSKDYTVTYYNQETGEIIKTPIKIAGSETQLAVAQSAGILRDNKLLFDTKIDLGLMTGEPIGDPLVNGLQIVISDLNVSDLLTPYELTNQSDVNVVKVVVQMPKLAAKTVRVTAFEKINVPEGLQVDFKTKYLDVIMRGPDFQLPYIDPEDITVQVDFSNATVDGDGSFTAAVIFTRYNQSFVVDHYIVEAIVTPVNG